jgi:hypothetical protein
MGADLSPVIIPEFWHRSLERWSDTRINRVVIGTGQWYLHTLSWPSEPQHFIRISMRGGHSGITSCDISATGLGEQTNVLILWDVTLEAMPHPPFRWSQLKKRPKYSNGSDGGLKQLQGEGQMMSSFRWEAVEWTATGSLFYTNVWTHAPSREIEIE